MKQQLLHLCDLAQRSSALPRGTRHTTEAEFFREARSLVPGLVEEHLRLLAVIERMKRHHEIGSKLLARLERKT